MPPSALPLSNWFVLSLRPVGQHRRLLQAARRLGATGIALPGLRLAAREDTPTRAALDSALSAELVIFTSPPAVRFAMRLRTEANARRHPTSRPFALGAATAAALRRAGGADAVLPARADSEALLDLPELRVVAGRRVGLVTAPGGRGLLAAGLRERGARLAIAEVYERRPARLTARHHRALLAARGDGAVCLTSAEALANVLAALPEAARARLLGCVAVVSSARLAKIAAAAGFASVALAAAPTPRALLDALVLHARRRGFR